MKKTAPGKIIFIVGTALLLGGCSGMAMPTYATYGSGRDSLNDSIVLIVPGEDTVCGVVATAGVDSLC